MRAARGGDRPGSGGRPHLVLLRGGLDRAAPEDADWKAFCGRIGWQEAERPLPDDYEEQLLGRIFAGEARRDAPPWIAGGTDEQWPLAAGAERWQPRARRASVAATVVVAAILCAAAVMMFWRATGPSVGAVACPDVEATPQAIPQIPVDDRAAPPAPSEPRSRPSRTKDAPTLPSPSDTKPPRPPPGALARRWQRDEGRARGAWHPAGAPALASLRGGDSAQLRGFRNTAAAAPIAAVDLHATTTGLPGVDRSVSIVDRTLPAIPRALADASTPEAWTRPASFARGVLPASASWSLSPESSRWFGVGLPPSSATAGLPSGVGVMGQLDVVKAIERL